MTIQQRLIDFLTHRGMFEAQANAVWVQFATEHSEDESRFREPWDSYDATMQSLWLIAIRQAGLKWIDANLPRAWFRPMFCPDPAAELAQLKGGEPAQETDC
jgi:hypothetical protein